MTISRSPVGPPVALNAPRDKGSSLTFRDVLSGVNASGRVRFTSSFPAQSVDFTGTACIADGGGLFEENCVDSYAIVDLTAGCPVGCQVLNTAVTLQLSVNNLFDTGYRSFVGVPKIGCFAMMSVRYEFF
jgi:outer membrane receptor protein involved in Fe transport